ncbi:MAG: general secretion pathway protein GspK [Acetobacteraceae bacterium]
MTIGLSKQWGETAERQRGFALLIVLWMLVLLAIVVSGIAASGHTESALASNLRNGAVAQAAADGAVAVALFHTLVSGPDHWPADGAPHVLMIGATRITVRILDQSGLVNPNTAPKALLVALLRRLGTDPGVALHIASAMVDWRSPGPAPSPGGAKLAQYRAADSAWSAPGGAFRSRREIALVLGMQPSLAARLAPYLSVYTEGEVDPRLAAPPVRQALADANGGVLPGFAPPQVETIEVTAEATSGAGARFTRRAVIHVGAAANSLRTLAWQEGNG